MLIGIEAQKVKRRVRDRGSIWKAEDELERSPFWESVREILRYQIGKAFILHGLWLGYVACAVYKKY